MRGEMSDVPARFFKKSAFGKTIFAGMAFIFALLGNVGEAAAYQTAQEHVVNDFSFAVIVSQIQASLLEPSWTEENGQWLLPGEFAAKDPLIENTSLTDTDLFAAMRVAFVYSDSCPDAALRGEILSEQDMEAVNRVVVIDYEADRDGAEWIRFTGESRADQVQHFYYRPVLHRNLPGDGDRTVPLFGTVLVKETTKNSAYARLQEMGGFALAIDGCVLEAGNETNGYAKTSDEAYTEGSFSFVCESGS